MAQSRLEFGGLSRCSRDCSHHMPESNDRGLVERGDSSMTIDSTGAGSRR